jgi:uncharacterized cysteine cluster protein YcgN (CxxCxxCC family)
MSFDDLKEYAALQDAQEKEWESACNRCGACCGVAEGDPCEHLVKAQDGKYACSIYENRYGIHKTVNGNPFKCVPMRQLLHTSWTGDFCCGYKKKYLSK